MKEILKEDIKILKRNPEGHKGSFGRLLIIAGSENYPGAAALSTLAALRSGVGLTTLLTENKVIDRIFPLIPEAVLCSMDKFSSALLEKELMKSTAVVLGPGLGRKKGKLIKYVLKNYKGPLVLDADGINAITPDILKLKKGGIVLTPHEGEFSRLTGKPIAEISKNREKEAVSFSQKYGVHLILKGKGTIVSDPEGNAFINTTGGSSLAKGGSGDVLSGILGSFLAMGDDILAASKKAVFIHGLSGDIAAEEKGEHSVLARDVIAALPKAILALSEK
jgi:NAD(P)H-hydrate epimerase